MENLVTTGKIQGKRGRHREKIMDGVCRWLCVNDNKGIYRDVRDRTILREKHDQQRFKAGYKMMMTITFVNLFTK